MKTYTENLNIWIEDEKAAIEFINVIGKLWFNKSVELVLFRNQLFDRSSSSILKLHQYAQNVVNQPISIHDTLALATVINELDIAPSRIDIGKLASEWNKEKKTYGTVKIFITSKLSSFFGENKLNLVPKDVVLFGFGRIGRLLARELISQAGKGQQLRLRAIVTRDKDSSDLIKRATLLENDSVHGPFPGTIIIDDANRIMNINGHRVHLLYANGPEDLDYTQFGIENALLIDNTGVYRDRESLSRHLKSKGISQVLLTAPAKGDVPNIVHGVNHLSLDLNETIYSAASCTTNAISPILAVAEKTLGIERCHVETIHSYTNDQNLLDNFHKKYRRGRSAAVNMVITETGADKAVAKVIPELAGKLTGNAIRVPTPNGSLAILNIQVKNPGNIVEVNEIFKNAALNGDLVEQIQYSISNELVSSDIIGSPHPSIFDSAATIVSNDGKSVILYIWYDNEYGYSRQVMRLAKYISNVLRLRYY